MKKNVIISLILSVLLLGFGTAFAATSQIDNLPGGAGIAYFHATAAGDATLLNIQNIQPVAVMVHVTIYDKDSRHLIDFTVPLSGYDNWGGSITGNGTQITITPQAPCFFGGLNNGCFTPLVRALAADANGFQKGYLTTVISASDGNGIATVPALVATPTDGDPRNDTIITGRWANLPNWIFARTAILNPTAGSAIALNATMLQDFVNFPATFSETAVSANSMDSITNTFNIPILWNCDGDSIDVFTGSDDPAFGLNVDSWEIMITTQLNGGYLIADDFAPVIVDGVGDTVYPALGSAFGAYWGRYNENPTVPSQTTLITVFPANSGTNHSPACGFSSRCMSVFSFDDNEFPISTPVCSDEVGRIEFGPAGIAVPGFAGEAQIIVDAPMFGFTYTEAGNFADLYPLVKEGMWLNTMDGLSPYAFDITRSEVIYIGR